MDETNETAGDTTPEPVAEETVENKDAGPEMHQEKKRPSKEYSGQNKYFLTGLIGFIAALLVSVLVVGSFAIGYAVGNDDPVLPRDRLAENMGQKQSLEGPGGASGRLENRRERAGEVMEEFGAELVRGKVVSIEAGKLVLETSDGDQTIRVTDSTVIGGKQDIAAGDHVTVMLKEVEGAEPEAVIIRALGNLN
ncbi:MAG: hypothetical protein JW738_07525 [Actinobacteria bacterium]|nr:hypothetical protein [Actinomycetota bacterium]